jgi:predicted DNA-binding transcriptional regulator AlpA
MSKLEKKGKIPKAELRRLLKQSKKREAIAKRYGVSRSTVDRLIRKHRLSHLVRKGRTPLSKRPQKIKLKPLAGTWVSVKNYVRHLDNEYHFVNVNGPPLKYVNQKTLVCSNTRRNPAGPFTTVGIYSIVYVSNVYFLFTTSIRYSQQPKPFKEIHNWVNAAAPAILEESYHSSYFVVRIVAYTFHSPKRKPKAIRYA